MVNLKNCLRIFRSITPFTFAPAAYALCSCSTLDTWCVHLFQFSRSNEQVVGVSVLIYIYLTTNNIEQSFVSLRVIPITLCEAPDFHFCHL